MKSLNHTQVTGQSEYFVSTFYRFVSLPDPEKTKKDLKDAATKDDISGLMIIGHEGFNATVSAANKDSLSRFQKMICEYFNCPDLFFKDSVSAVPPFRRFVVKIRDEIVTLGTPELVPDNRNNHHLSPAEWNHVLKNEPDVLVIDTRNWYETQIGTFKNAVNPNIDKFTEFPRFVEEKSLQKDQKMLIFCTGGIRCEKGILELQRQGFSNVYQLDGGIINYLKQFPNDEFEGECFVFDHRVAVDQNLKPSATYGLCPHCGQPAKKSIDCKRCDSHALICDDCLKLEWKKDTCSKNCAYQFSKNPTKKGKQQIRNFKMIYKDQTSLQNLSHVPSQKERTHEKAICTNPSLLGTFENP